jgi:hypothetical protein
MDERAIGRHDIHRPNGVTRPSKAARQIAKPATDRQAGDTGRGHKPHGRRESVKLRLAIDITEEAASFHAGGAGLRIDANASRSRHVEREPVVADRQSRYVVTTALDRKGKAMLPCEGDTRCDIGGAETTQYQCRSAIDHGVPDGARLVIRWFARDDELTEHSPLEIVDDLLLELNMIAARIA